MIQSLDNNTIRRISSGQVITKVEDVVKELIENSIDAQATSIEVRLVADGLTSIVVKDNGLGITESDRPAMALRYHTSKLEDFGGLSKVETYGFRGEALNSICAISESMQITTKTSKDPVAVNYLLDRAGKIVDSKSVGITEGTTVVVTMLFSPVPVRRHAAQKNSSKVGKAVQHLLTTYALAHPHIRFLLKLVYDNAAKLNFKAGEWILPPMKSQMQSLNELYGVELTNNVGFVVWDTNKEETSMEIENEDYDILDGSNGTKSTIIIEAILPRPDATPHAIFKNGQSFIYVNNRPVIATRGEIKSIVSMVKSTYTDIACKHGWIANKKTPFMWINIKLPTYDYDSERILNAVENMLISVYGSCQKVSSEKEYRVPQIDSADPSSSNNKLSPISSEILDLSSNEPSLNDVIVLGSSSVSQRSPETIAQNDPELIIIDTNDRLSEDQIIASDKKKGKMIDHESVTSQISDQATKRKVNKEKKNDVKASRSLEEWYKNAQTSDVPTTLPIYSPSSTPPHTNNLQHKGRKGSKNTMSNPLQGQFDNENSGETCRDDEDYTHKRARTDDSEDIVHSQMISINSCDDTIGDSRKIENRTELEIDYESTFTNIVNVDESTSTNIVNVDESTSTYIVNVDESTSSESINETNVSERVTLESESIMNVSEQLLHEPVGSKVSPKKQSALPKQGSGVRTIIIGQPTIDVLIRSDGMSNVLTKDDINKSQETPKRKSVQDARKALEFIDTLNHELKLKFDKQKICRKEKSLGSPVKFIDISSSINCLNKMDCGLWTLSTKLNDNVVNLLIVHGERIRELVTLQTLVTSTELLPTRKLSTPIDIELELLGSDSIISYLKSLSYDPIPDENGAGVWWNMINQKCITANGIKIRWREDCEKTYVQITHISPLVLFASAVDYFSNLMQHLTTINGGTKDVSLASTRAWQTMKILASEAKQLVKQEDAKIVKRDDEMQHRIKESIIFLLRKMPNFGNEITYIDLIDHEPPLVMVERKGDEEIWYNDQMVVKLLWKYNAKSDEMTHEQ
ncbi:43309_t:CDS:10 [Gigaspora margarita]|uniref:43309_t:CDS:1 n=1 Tax=Gigaspora margarita TaxID=4874 RepID=A0ABN7V4L7_GIGMA|nr:43309_t:CDS:10 [Gigaspora margarita]